MMMAAVWVRYQKELPNNYVKRNAHRRRCRPGRFVVGFAYFQERLRVDLMDWYPSLRILEPVPRSLACCSMPFILRMASTRDTSS